MKTIARTIALTVFLGAPLCAAAATSQTYQVTQRYALGGLGSWDYLTLDPSTHNLFIARDDRLTVVDTSNGKIVGEIPGMEHAHGVAVIPKPHRAYATSGHGNFVSVIDLDTLKVTGKIAVNGKNPDAIIYDSASRHVLTMNGDSNSISVIDPDSGKELKTIALEGNPEFAASDGAGNVYVNLEDKGELAHIDINAGVVKHNWSLAPCEGPTGLALDSAHKRLFSVCANGWLIVTDANDGHQVAKIQVGKKPDAVAYDTQTQTIFSPGREGVLNVIHQDDADHYTPVATVPTMKYARTLALDPASHNLYLVGAKNAERGQPVSGFTMLVVGAH
ncbi:YVTN family beta-propeller protein [Luteibacter rhizovicinus]|uniref:YVTN family beta-propeller protein n=1 Tax=Luteibacter rhizovicinus TaxID=242606 RepID=A0A4R3YMC8_9GAMM|nr:YncE family protein [Luteibacter rhizovicinus]TCV93421.1 YVTN family beta-propeller protein [Luteibacter rhizovicinus]